MAVRGAFEGAERKVVNKRREGKAIEDIPGRTKPQMDTRDTRIRRTIREQHRVDVNRKKSATETPEDIRDLYGPPSLNAVKNKNRSKPGKFSDKI